MFRPGAFVAVAAMLLPALSGCLDAYDEFEGFDADAQYHNPGVFEGSYLMGNNGPLPLQRGILRAPLFPEIVILESARPAYGEAAALMGEDARVDIVMAIWRPDNYTGPMPVIVDAGPYYEQGDSTIEGAAQSTPFMVQNMLPRGYAVVQLAVRGTGTAGGCMDLMGPDEAHDLDQAITWLGEQEWSNGNVGMMGVSYDGSTPWVVAGMGNPHLKTIVPISGLPDIYDLMFRNGSAEWRGGIMHSTVGYWGYGFSGDFPREPADWPLPGFWLPAVPLGSANGRAEYQDRQNLLCPEAIEGQALGLYSAVDGSRGSAASTYWTERDHRQRVLDNYKGSVFLIHGLQDWNVDPHAAIPFNQALRDAGLDVKQWYGQWDHAAPHSFCDPGAPAWVVLPCRLDYGEVLARWYDKYLMGYPSILNVLPPEVRDDETLRQGFVDVLEEKLGHGIGDLLDTGPAIQVQDNIGFWRNADSFPPTDPAWSDLGLGADGTLGGGTGGDIVLPAPAAGEIKYVALTSEPLADGLHLSGMPQLKLPFSVQGQGGQIAAWLFDVDPAGQVRAPMAFQRPREEDMNITKWTPSEVPVIGHAAMNLRYYAGGEEAQVLQPGERYVAQIQFEPLEVHIPAGHRLLLWLFQYDYEDHQGTAIASGHILPYKLTPPAEVTLHFDQEAKLRLPVLELDPRTVFPVPAVRFPNSTYIPQMYVRLPVLQGVEPAALASVADGAVDAPQATRQATRESAPAPETAAGSAMATAPLCAAQTAVHCDAP